MKTAPPARTLFAALMRQPDRVIPLDRAALLIAQEEYPDLELQRYLNMLDFMAVSLRRMIGDAAEPRAIIAALNQLLFVEERFSGNTADYYDPSNSYLNEVLDRRTGIPLTLSLLYMEIARRVGLHLSGVGLPGHFLLRYDGRGGWRRGEPLLIDPFQAGKVLTVEAARLRFRGPGTTRRPDPVTVAAADTRSILTRMLTNLKLVYLRQADYDRALAASERILLVKPRQVAEVRDRALINVQRGALGDALWDLERYQVLAPDSPDISTVQEQARTIWQRLSQLN